MIGFISWMARLISKGPVASPVPLPPGVTLVRSRLVTSVGGRTAGMKGPAAAVTLGRTILIRPGVTLSKRLLLHELAHVRQWERFPMTFPFRYVTCHVLLGYGRNPYEAEARAAESGRSPAGEIE